MSGSLKEFEILDDIGFIGIPGYKQTPEDIAVFARKGVEARQRYFATQTENTITAPQVAYA